MRRRRDGPGAPKPATNGRPDPATTLEQALADHQALERAALAGRAKLTSDHHVVDVDEHLRLIAEDIARRRRAHERGARP